MGVSVMKIYEYTVECDNCTALEVYHTLDWDNGISAVLATVEEQEAHGT